MLEGGGPVLGILSIAPYSEQRERLEPGDMLVHLQRRRHRGHQPRLRRVRRGPIHRRAAQAPRQPATKIVEAVTKALTEFAAGAPQADDITLVVAKRL